MLPRDRLLRSPAALRVAPFVIFVLLTAAQGKFGAESAYWFYLAKTIVGAAMIFALRSLITEMRWAFSWEAVAVGAGIFAVWVGTDPLYPHFFKPGNENPFSQFAGQATLAWFFCAVHVLGMTFVVPPLEEVFFRSFLYRYLVKQEFLSVPMNRFLPLPFFATAIVFGCEHSQWLAGILCGAAYQWLVLRKNRLGDAMTAHAITNFLLGVWVVWRGAWNFW
jgi:CAAX prenyl protease-like protein